MPVNIHGREYYTVAERVQQLNKEVGRDKYSLITTIVSNTDGVLIMKANLQIGDQVYIGHSLEREGSSQINKTSHLENAETSAIGRALAAAGFLGHEYASANEVENAVHQQDKPVKRTSPASDKQKKFIRELLSSPVLTDEYRAEHTAKLSNGLSVEDASHIIEDVKHEIENAHKEYA